MPPRIPPTMGPIELWCSTCIDVSAFFPDGVGVDTAGLLRDWCRFQKRESTNRNIIESDNTHINTGVLVKSARGVWMKCWDMEACMICAEQLHTGNAFVAFCLGPKAERRLGCNTAVDWGTSDMPALWFVDTAEAVELVHNDLLSVGDMKGFWSCWVQLYSFYTASWWSLVCYLPIDCALLVFPLRRIILITDIYDTHDNGVMLSMLL